MPHDELSFFHAVSFRIAKPINEVLQLANGDTYPICPRCGRSIEYDYVNFCGHCGQRLHWTALDYCQIKTVPLR